MSATNFKGVFNIGDDTISPLVEKNVTAWLDWCTLGIGGYFVVGASQSGAFGGNWGKLHLTNAEEEGFSKGRVWEGVRKNWAYEGSVGYTLTGGASSITPVLGLYVGNNYYATGTTVPTGSGYNINWPLGRIEFDNPMPITSDIRIAYTHKYYSYETSKVGWFRELAYRSFRPDEETLDTYGSGIKTVLNHNRIQLPAVVVEVGANTRLEGLQLGGGQWMYKTVKFHIFAENPWDCTKMVDILTYQNETTISGFDLNTMAQNSGMPLTPEGYTWSGTKVYPQLLSDYPWGTIRLFNMGAYDEDSNHFLSRAVVTATCELCCPRL